MIMATGQILREAKVVLLGSSCVGKSSIMTRLVRGTFKDGFSSTIGAAFLSKTINVGDTQVKLQIWDTGGSERYRSLTSMYFQGAQAAIIVFDLSIPNTFQDVDYWLKELKDKGPPSMIIGLAGNKSDLQNQRMISSGEIDNLVAKQKIRVFKETSALNGQNINELFTEIATMISKSDTSALNNDSTVNLTQQEEKEKKCCH